LSSLPAGPQSCEGLASYQNCINRIRSEWPEFLRKRSMRLQPHELFGEATEKIAENILEDLFTGVLDWSTGDFLLQLNRADIVLADHGIKHLIIEAKRPRSLAWNHSAVEQAIAQALRYASEQKVKRIAVSDGFMLYAVDLCEGGTHDRVFVDLSGSQPPFDLWWLSVQGIYREKEFTPGSAFSLLPQESASPDSVANSAAQSEELLHPKYQIPARCFAYVSDHADPHTWKLPYLLSNGAVDSKRLPKAIQCILSNYRGAKVSGIPESAIPDVLARLARAAAQSGHLPVTSQSSQVYQQLVDALDQLGISDRVPG
jgi:hypothetical protein